VDVEKFLLEDSMSFAKEIESFDEEGFINRTLAALGILSADSDAAIETEEGAPGAGRIQRPAPAGGPGPALSTRIAREQDK
jgi:hypothetical protein